MAGHESAEGALERRLVELLGPLHDGKQRVVQRRGIAPVYGEQQALKRGSNTGVDSSRRSRRRASLVARLRVAACCPGGIGVAIEPPIAVMIGEAHPNAISPRSTHATARAAARASAAPRTHKRPPSGPRPGRRITPSARSFSSRGSSFPRGSRSCSPARPAITIWRRAGTDRARVHEHAEHFAD